MRVATPLTVALLIACFGAVAHAADRVHLKNGRSLVGEITAHDDERVHLETKFGTMRFSAADVDRIERNVTLEEPEPAETPPAKPTQPTKLDPAKDAGRGHLEGATDEPDDTDADESARTAARALSRARTRAAIEAAAKDSAVIAKMLRVVEGLESETPRDREHVLEDIVVEWPATSPALSLVFEVGSDVARVDAARVLRHTRLGDTTEMVRTLFRDPSAAVRIQALRVAFARSMVDLESDVLAIAAGNSEWSIRQDAARTLERIGGKDSFRTIVDVWTAESDAERKNWLRRVLVAIAGEDLGDEPEVWAAAVNEAFIGERVLRDPRGDAARTAARDGDASTER